MGLVHELEKLIGVHKRKHLRKPKAKAKRRKKATPKGLREYWAKKKRKKG